MQISLASNVSFLPEPDKISSSRLSNFMKYMFQSTGLIFDNYFQLEEFSIRDFRQFWQGFLSWASVIVEGSPDPVCAGNSVEHAVFFPNLTLNYAENLLAGEDDRLAVVACHAGRPTTYLSRDILRKRVQRAAAALADLGIKPGDRVVAITYNNEEAVVACLAAAAIGASFSSAAPEMGARATLSRFSQLSPIALIAHTEQRSGNQLREVIAEVVSGLPTLEYLITLDDPEPIAATTVKEHALADLIERAQPLAAWPRFPFNHPLFILFSSGTTGAPKCIVHGAGGTLLEHLKEHRLHTDLRPNERMFFQTSCAWMMWNWQLSALASQAAIVLYDGAVDHPDRLWRICSEQQVNVFGTSPAYLKMCESASYVPRNPYDYPKLRAILSTGSVLYDAQYEWVLRDVKRVPLQSISGGTDIIGCFVLGNPNLPVWRGEAQCRSLAMDVQAAAAAPDGIGDLICCNPFPSRPCGFFGDKTGEQFHRAYFSQNPGVWTHGDRIAFTPHGSARLHGRSDGVLNVHGIRVGPAEIYAALQDVPELLEALAVEQSVPQDIVKTRIVLLVVLASGATLTDELVLRMRRQITRHAGAAHVPAVIAAVPELPTTHSGKKSEAAARDAVNGQLAANRDALRNPDCLITITNHPALRPSALSPVVASSGQGTGAVLQQIWANAFGVSTIGLDDDFFELGGDSLLAVQICTHINNTLDYDLPISTIFQNSTVAALAKILDGGVTWQGDSPIVPLQQGIGAPVFLMHSLTGTVFEWHALLRRLQCPHPVYALQARGLNPAETPSETVQAMAADYVDLIQAREPNGPYILLGYSFGGLLAYHIAVLLRTAGYQVQFVGMIDTALDQHGLRPRELWQFRLRRLRHFRQRTAAFGVPGALRHIRQRWTRHRMRVREAADAVSIDSLPPVLYRVRVACHKAMAAYKPPSYSGIITYFRSQEHRPEHCDPLTILRRSATELRIIDVPGSHATMMHDPNVAFLANEIALILNQPLSADLHELKLSAAPL